MIQAELVKNSILSRHPEYEIEIVPVDTTGDRVLDQPLDAVGGKGLFTRELEQALRGGSVDLAVHSLKDMPEELPGDLPILAYSRREDPRDALVLPAGAAYGGLARLAGGGPVGCSSARRKLQLLSLCGGLRILPVRGNVPTRLKKLDEGGFSALVLAAAGLNRLGLQGRVSRLFSASEILPAAGQGILAVQGRSDFAGELLRCVDDPDSRLAAEAERAVIAGLRCGCASPAAAYCRAAGEEIEIRALYVDAATGRRAASGVTGPRGRHLALAGRLAEELLRAVKTGG